MTHRRLCTSLLAASWVAALICALGVWAPLQVAAGLLLVLVLPGALVSYAAVPADSGVDWRLRGILAVSLSAVAAVLLGLVLALAFDEISRAAGALGLAAIATVAALIATVRGHDEDAIDLPRLPSVSPAVWLVTAVLAVACVVVAIATLEVDALPGDYTALSLTRDGDRARLTATNRQGQAETYRYAVRADGRLLRAGQVRIEDGEARVLLVPISRGRHRLEGFLYLDGRRPYRSVSLRLDASRPPAP